MEQKSSKLGLAQASCSLRSVSLTFLRPASIYRLVPRISWVSRKHTLPPKPANSQKCTVPPSFIPVNLRSLYKSVPEYLWAVIVYVHFHFSRHFLTLKIRNVRSTTVRSEFWESVFFPQTIVGKTLDCRPFLLRDSKIRSGIVKIIIWDSTKKQPNLLK